MFICQLPRKTRYEFYKAIKQKLIAEGCYTYGNLIEAMSAKVKDIADLL